MESPHDDVLIELEEAMPGDKYRHGAEAEAFQHAVSQGLLVRLGKEIDNLRRVASQFRLQRITTHNLRLEVARIGRCNEQLSLSHAEVVNELKRQISCMLGQDKPRDSDWDNWLDGEEDGEMARLRGELQAYRIVDQTLWRRSTEDVKLYRWHDELIIARDKDEARRLLCEQFTHMEVRFTPVEEVTEPVMLIDANEEQKACTPQDAVKMFPEPQIIPECQV